ncbi:hypothetical protein ACOMHN_015835 [Nucella lapillus]
MQWTSLLVVGRSAVVGWQGVVPGGGRDAVDKLVGGREVSSGRMAGSCSRRRGWSCVRCRTGVYIQHCSRGDSRKSVDCETVCVSGCGRTGSGGWRGSEHRVKRDGVTQLAVKRDGRGPGIGRVVQACRTGASRGPGVVGASRFYWFVNAGALIAYGGVAAIQQNISFAWGYVVPFLSMMLALVFFLLGRKHYRFRQHDGRLLQGVLARLQKVVQEGPRRHRVFRHGQGGLWGGYTSDTVDGVISVVRLLPIFFFVIMYWTIYSQMQSTFFLQGERMDLHIGSSQVPVAMLNAFNTIAIMLLIPFLDRVLYPCFHRLGLPLKHLHRIGIGFVLAALSMIAAAVVEVERKDHMGFNQTVGEEVFYSSHLSVFLQVPQFALVGASEAFTSISGLEFAFTQSPLSMQGVMMGVFLATTGLGSYLASLILRIVAAATKDDPWFPDDINDGHAEYLFYLLSILMVLFFLAYLVAAKMYKYRTFEQQPASDPGDVGEEGLVQENHLDVREDTST